MLARFSRHVVRSLGRCDRLLAERLLLHRHAFHGVFAFGGMPVSGFDRLTLLACTGVIPVLRPLAASAATPTPSAAFAMFARLLSGLLLARLSRLTRFPRLSRL